MSNTKWESVKEYEDILYDKFQGIARITINRPEVHNSFRPQTHSPRYLFALGSFDLQ